MRKHFVTTLLVVLGWAFLAPISWMGLVQAQGTPTTPTGLTIPANKAGNNLSTTTSYNGVGADYTVGQPNGTSFTGSPQDWYNVNLVAGYTYVFTMWQNGSSGIATAMSLQLGPTQVKWAYGEGADYCGMLCQLYYQVPMGQGGTYTLICAYTEWQTTMVTSVPYTLTIPYPTNYPTTDYPGVPVPTNVGSLASTYTDSASSITASSYYGSTANNGSPPGSPPAPTQPLWYQSYTDQQVPPAWVMYYQNWYSMNVAATGPTYVITLSLNTAGAGNPILSVQNSSGAQQGFFYSPGQTTATIYFTPMAVDTYYIICTQDLLGVPGAPNGCLGVNVPITNYTFSVSQVQAGATATSVSATPTMSTSPTTTVTVSVTALAAASGPPQGNVVLTVGSYTSPSTPVNPGSGSISTATFSVPTPAGGTYTVTAQFTGTGSAPPPPNGFLASSGTGPLNVINITQLTIPVNLGDSTSPGSYSGLGADTSLMTPTSASYGNYWNGGGPITNSSAQGLYQNWYAVPLVQNQTYVMSLWASINNQAIISVQNSSGTQVAWGVDSRSNWLGNALYPPQLVFTPQATDTYTVIVASIVNGAFMNYTLTIPSPTPAATPVNLPFAGSGTFSPTSYYGAATLSSAGSPPPAQIGAPFFPLPNWVDYFQNWYSIPLAATETVTINMTMSPSNPTASAPILSIQSSSGVPQQVNYSYTPGSTTASISFTPTTSDTYQIICSQDIAGPGNVYTQGPGNSYTLAISGSGGSVGTKTNVYPGIDLPPNNLNVTVKVTAVGGAPTGNVTLSLDGNPVGTQTLSGGSTVFNIPNPGAGNHTLSAVYAGALPAYMPSQGSAPLVVGIPNVRLLPPAGNNADILNMYALALNREPAAYPVDEIRTVRRWESRNDS